MRSNTRYRPYTMHLRRCHTQSKEQPSPQSLQSKCGENQQNISKSILCHYKHSFIGLLYSNVQRMTILSDDNNNSYNCCCCCCCYYYYNYFIFDSVQTPGYISKKPGPVFLGVNPPKNSTKTYHQLKSNSSFLLMPLAMKYFIVFKAFNPMSTEFIFLQLL